MIIFAAHLKTMKKRLYIKRILAAFCLMFLAVGGFLFWASSYIDSGVYIKTLCKGSDDRRCVSLTFDDGPDEFMTPKVLDILKENDIKATFFIIGSKAEKYPELVSRIIDEGHLIGSHSWDHRVNFPVQPSDVMCQELSKCEDFIFELTGKSMLFFRPPCGITNPLVADAVEQMGYHTIGWSIRSLDTKKKKSRSEILGRISKRLHNGAVILLHDRCDGADELLRSLLTLLQENDYDVIPLDDLLSVEAYGV